MSKNKRRAAPIIALGTMTFGAQTSAKDAGRMMARFVAAGHSWIDTAFMYTDGKSERVVGNFLKGSRRGKVFLATKAYPDKLGKGKPRGLTPGSIRGQLETSLRRLKTDCVDLFYLHAPDNRTPLAISLATVQKLREEGKLIHLGLSNYAAWQVAEAALICERNNWPKPIVYQGMYNAITRDIERECIVACHHFGLKFIAYNPLAGGLLTGKHLLQKKVPPKGRFSGEYYRDRFWRPEYFRAVEHVKEVARGRRMAPADAALRWLVRHSMADGLIIGASKMAHFEQNVAACAKKPLSSALVAAFDEAWEIARPVCQRYFRD